jgi:hypothetical protein
MQLHQASRRTYDHRIREHVYRTRNPHLFPDLHVPRSTTATWLQRGCPTVVSCTPTQDDVAALRVHIENLETRGAADQGLLPGVAVRLPSRGHRPSAA